MVTTQDANPLTTAVVSPPEALPGRILLRDEAEWVAWRDSAVAPQRVSDLVTSEQHRAEFLEGARLLRLYGERAYNGAHPWPVQLMICDMLAAGHRRNALLAPRRSTKTTGLIEVAIGRAAHREDYRVGFLDTRSGKAGRQRFLKDVAAPIESLYRDPKERPMRVSRRAGAEGLEWPDGGSVSWLTSERDIRGEAFDLLILDEAGVPSDPQEIKDLMAAALPSLDTRKGQLVVAGTAGAYRDGNLLWTALEVGRAGRGGIIEYAADDATTAEQLEAWEPDAEHPEACVRELVELTHPGVGHGTPLEVVEDNYRDPDFPIEVFAAEYLGIWGTVAGTGGIFDLERWTAAGSGAEPPALPERFSLAFAIHPDASRASVLASWRDGDGRAVPLLLENRSGVEWLPKVLYDIARKYKTPVVYDAGSQQARLVVDRLNREQTRPRVEAQVWNDVKKAAALVVQEVARGNVLHFRQDDLDAAIRLAVKRAAGAGDGWALGRPKTDLAADITAAEAWALALLHYDGTKPRQRTRAVVVT